MPWHDIAIAFLVAFSVVGSLFATRFQESLGADEAYVWYGLLRMRKGEVPQRDFRAYEPGRYLWCWMFALILGSGLGTVRLATHVFYGLCLGVALATMRSMGLGWLEVSLAALLLAAWAQPMFKLYEPGLFILAFSTSTWLLLFPSPTTAMLAGGVVGLALLFGFNLFLYLGAALVLVFAIACALAITLPLGLFGLAILGGIVGALPFCAYLVTPGFLPAFIERRITSILRRGSTNLPLKAPWPWRSAAPQLRSETRLRQLAYGVLFALLPIVPILAIALIWALTPVLSPRMAGVIAAASLGGVLWHHAYSRADRAHLVPSAAPLVLMAALATPSSLALAVLAAASIALTWTYHPQIHRKRAPQKYKLLQLDRLKIWVAASQHRLVERAAELTRDRLAHGGSLLALPSLLSLYPILDLRAPIYDIYAVFPASQSEQERMLKSIVEADVRVAFISDTPLDGREDLRFSNTHPLVWRHLNATMERVDELPGSVHVFARF